MSLFRCSPKQCHLPSPRLGWAMASLLPSPMLWGWAGSALCPLPGSNTLGPSNTPTWSTDRTLTGGPETLAPGGPTGPMAPFTPGDPCRREGTSVTGHPAGEIHLVRSWASLSSHIPCGHCRSPPKHCRPSAQGGRGSPWYPSLQRGQGVPEVPEAPAERSTVGYPLF